MVRRTRPSRVRRIGQPLRRLRRHNPRIIAAATLASHPGRCVLTLCVGPDETGSWRMEAVPSELWDGRHFVIEQPCPGGYCNRRALHSYHYAIVNNAARNEGGRHGMGWGYYHNEKEHRSCTECAEIMATKCYREMKVWAKSDLGSGIIAVLQGRTNADKFKAKWSPLYPLHDWAFTKLFAATVELNFDGFRISREQGRRLGLSKFDLSPEFYASPFKCRCLVGCPERLTRSMTTYKQPTEGKPCFAYPLLLFERTLTHVWLQERTRSKQLSSRERCGIGWWTSAKIGPRKSHARMELTAKQPSLALQRCCKDSAVRKSWRRQALRFPRRRRPSGEPHLSRTRCERA